MSSDATAKRKEYLLSESGVEDGQATVDKATTAISKKATMILLWRK